MTNSTSRFALPFILPGQAQKEMFHNDALLLIDAVLHPAVEAGPLQTPPSNPAPGQAWLVAPGANGAWGGKDNSLAAWTDGGWRFVPPAAGMRVWRKGAGLWLHWTGTAWSDGEVVATKLTIGGVQVVGSRAAAVPSPSGGTTIDAEARTAVNGLIATLKSHGLIN